MKSFSINQDTLCFTQNGDKRKETLVVEKDRQLVVEMSALSYIKGCCKLLGYSYNIMRKLVIDNFNFYIKTPIIVSEYEMIIFFPTSSPDLKECIWISYNNIERYIKVGKYTKIYFKGGKILNLNVSFTIIDSQITKCIKIEKFLRDKRDKSK